MGGGGGNMEEVRGDLGEDPYVRGSGRAIGAWLLLPVTMIVCPMDMFSSNAPI